MKRQDKKVPASSAVKASPNNHLNNRNSMAKEETATTGSLTASNTLANESPQMPLSPAAATDNEVSASSSSVMHNLPTKKEKGDPSATCVASVHDLSINEKGDGKLVEETVVEQAPKQGTSHVSVSVEDNKDSENTTEDNPDHSQRMSTGTTTTTRNSLTSTTSSNGPNNSTSSKIKARGKRNSLALRKNIPSIFALSFIMPSSMQSSELYDDTQDDVEAFGGTAVDANETAETSARGGAKTRANQSSDNIYSFTSSHGQRNNRKQQQPPITQKRRLGILRRTCLHPKLSLRSQLFLSFGFVSVVMILFVMMVCIIVTLLSGQQVNNITSNTFDDLAADLEGTTVRYIAEFVQYRLVPTDLVQLIWEIARDRIAGYPDAPRFEDDLHVPFWDTLTQQNRYPIKGPQPLPLDWEIKTMANVNGSNYQEHVQEHRWPWYQLRSHDNPEQSSNEPCVSTASAVYFMQGMCDPSVTNPMSNVYYPNCDEANNNVSTGGVVAPTRTNQYLHGRSADLSPMLKALYEYHQDVKAIAIAFANDGAGSTVQFPHYPLCTKATYRSEGCDWMRQPNPFRPDQPIGTEEMIQNCHPEETDVSFREYNPMEQGWCQKQALQPHKVHIDGPRLDEANAWQSPGDGSYRWLVTIGRAIYDRVTNEFVGCIKVNIVLGFLEQVLSEARVTANSHLTVVKWDKEGTVVASTARNMTRYNHTVTIDQLDVGVSKKKYQSLKNLIDYSQPWESSDIRTQYEGFVSTFDDYMVGGYPLPPPPADYDSDYRPEFLVIKSLSKDDVYTQLHVSQGSVDDSVKDLVNLSLLIGLIGIFFTLAIIFMVSNHLTAPLQYMNDVATEIVNNYAEDTKDDGIKLTQPKYATWCTPKTEVSEVVAGFGKMVARFSGSSNANVMKGRLTEVQNQFELISEFSDLYASRQDNDFKYRIGGRSASLSTHEHHPEETECYLSRKHTGSLFPDQHHDEDLPFDGNDSVRSLSDLTDSRSEQKWFQSPLFIWIVVLIAIPLLLTTITLSAIAMHRISNEFPDLVEDAKLDYVNLDYFAVQVYVGLRASFVTVVTSRFARDLHLLTRMSSWLVFGGVERTDAFTRVVTSAETCKHYENISECPLILEKPCDCAWNDPYKDQCKAYETDSRYDQHTFYNCESHDIGPDGDRNRTSFPEVAYSPNTTEFWNSFESMPGFERGNNAFGYDTTYDRVRFLSSIPLFQPLYNYDIEKEFARGGYVAMEDDGMFAGFWGCMDLASGSAFRASTETNGAPDIRPELCPEGKYGYDARCRDWYDTGRKLYQTKNRHHHLTAPYKFGLDDTVAQTITAPLADPESKRHVGQVAVDFESTRIFDALDPANTAFYEGSFPVLITPHINNFGGDTVVGPGRDPSDQTPAPPIEDLVFMEGGQNCSSSRCAGISDFRETVSNMKRGEKDFAVFAKGEPDGTIGSFHLAYAPVIIKTFSVVDSSDFARGVVASDEIIYSLAFAGKEQGILAPFKAIEEEVDHQRNIALAIICIVISISTLVVVYISSRVAASITEPMLYLLELIKNINRLEIEDITKLSPDVNREFGCREVRHVSSTMEVLYKIVRDANVAFFAGDIETAYTVLTDTLRLFQRLDNKKAIGVGSNNLGNMMLTIYRTMKETKESRVCGFSEREIVVKGIGYFHQAIKLGEAAYDQFYEAEGWSPNCLEFMQHLSNRYFNRAMFLLSVKDSYKNPKELEDLGFRDLQIVKDMDVEIVDEGSQVGWNVRTADRIFDVKHSRIKGHLQLLEMGYPDDWEVDELIDEATAIVEEELKRTEGDSKLFEEVSNFGRIQQVETALMRYLLLKKEVKTAARIAIRMLVEDEYTLPDAQATAVGVLLEYIKSEEAGADKNGAYDRITQDLMNYQVWLNSMDQASDLFCSVPDSPANKDVSEAFLLSAAKLTGSNETVGLRSSIRQSTRGDFTMEIF